MNIRRPRWPAIAVSLAVIAAVAGITLGVTTLLGVTFQGEGSAQQGDGSRQVEGLLLTANRDRLAVCVQAAGVDRSVEGKAKGRIEAALTEVRKHPRWGPAGLGTLPPVVDTGCPSPPVIYQPGVQLIRLGGKGLHVEPMPIVAEASYYRVFVFIVPSAELDRIFAGERPRAVQEFLKSGDVAFEVTVGLYLSPDQLEDSAYLSTWLTKEVGLQAATD